VGQLWKQGCIVSWKSTQNGLEALAAAHNHGLLCLDELGQSDPREVAECIYALSNGRGMQRMTRTVAPKKTLVWSILFLASGEISLAEHVQLANRRTRAGQEVRLCDIPADAGEGLGAFENVHGFSSPPTAPITSENRHGNSMDPRSEASSGSSPAIGVNSFRMWNPQRVISFWA
jgi:uncharacterized protein (DUF927 family)